MPENKSKFLVPAIGATVVVVGGIAAYMYFFKGPTGDAEGALASAKIIPNEALMATYITTDSQAWSQLEKFGTPEARKIVTEGLKEFHQKNLEGNNISYEQDIKPWLGGLMVAVLPPNGVKPAQSSSTDTLTNTNSSSPNTPNTLMVVGIKDKVAALNFANKIKQQDNVKVTETDYKGEKIIISQGAGSSQYSAILDNNSYIVVADNQRLVEKSIDTLKGGASFATKPGANEILSKKPAVENAIAQVYIPDYAGMVETLIKTNPAATPIPPQNLEQIKQIKSMVAGVGIDNVGIRMKATVNLDPKLNPYQYENSPGQIVARFPRDTIAMVAGKGINRWWNAVVEQSQNLPEMQAVVDGARTYGKYANLDLDKEVFAWMDGEFGLALIPSNQGVLAQTGFGGAFVFDTQDRKTAESTLGKLDQLVKTQNPAINITKRNISGKDVTEWEIPGQGAFVSHGWLDQDTVFLTLGGPLANAIANNNDNLTNSETFKSVTSSLQQPNGGYFYLDMDKTMTILNRFGAVTGIDPQAKAIFDSIRGLGVTASSPDKSTSQVEFLLALKQSQ
ncbi:DUF3352 domain-containing protein [Calothrix sp. NIES-3974]|uniref:DUF3352 domain-containing protein n=1 Tax=Calothrix sp. NIES-3974 TaxID=2005462 RepID=UPI000B618658|nr:DUF3352 domain-containing protein [Calothrix sp. NIES-3974]BAZ07587.1 hypothetical protein NIES3974_42510 [Calothrix sp. NIES-3974]